MKRAHRTVYFVPHTHWDREWYQPFEVFRARLVDVVDRVLELLHDDPSYRRFTLDGQAVVLDDYLEVRPERAAEIAEQVRAGRLRIGPWYVLADEFLVSPEALVRNLAHGLATCRRFGTPMPVAYTPDSFGHIAQLPLIVKGFGLDAVVFQRGVGDEGERLRSEFAWLAADGATRIFAVHLVATYSTATAIGHLDWELGDTYDPERARRHFETALYGASDPDVRLPEWLGDALRRLEGGLDAYATGEAVLMLNGSDHLFPQANLPAIIADLDGAFAHVDVVHADVEEYVRAAQAQASALATHAGEFRGSRYHHVLSGVLSSRMYLKQANQRAQDLLERYAEPLAALARDDGGPDLRAFLQVAWRRLLLNHAHDSICGCSIDPVHRDMLQRFEQVMQLGDDICRRAIDHLAAHRDDPRDERRETSHLVLFNPLPVATRAVLTSELRLPVGGAARLALLDGQGRRLPQQLDVRLDSLPGRADEPCEEVRVQFLAELPPLGVTSVRVTATDADAGTTDDVNGDTGDGSKALAGDARRLALEPAAAAKQRGDAVVLDNGRLQAEIDATGAVTLIDLGDGSRRALRLRFEDEGDAGDEYDAAPVPPTVSVGTSLAPARIVEPGPVRASAALRYQLALPERLAADRRSRVGATSLEIRLTLSLEADAHRLDLTVELDNRADDHRLRLLVASGCQAEQVWADGHFHVLARDVRPPAAEGWYQAPAGTGHQRRFVAVSDATSDLGLALLNRGLPEYQALPSDAGVDVAVTLLRCVGWLSRDDLPTRPQGAGPALPTPGAQCHGRHRFELAVVPFRGAWWEGPLALEAERFATPPRAFPAPGPASVSAAVVPPPFTLSAFKPADDGSGTVMRLWNPAPEPRRGRIELRQPTREVHLVRLDETREAPLQHGGGGLELALGPAQVVSLTLVPDGREVPD